MEGTGEAGLENGATVGEDIGRASSHESNNVTNAITAGGALTAGDYLQYGYLLRVPILAGATLVALPMVSLYTFRALLGNLFVVKPAGIFWTMVAAVMLALSILVVFRVILLNGEERFRVRQGLSKDAVTPLAVLVTEALWVPTAIALVFSNGQARNWHEIWPRVGCAAGGIVLANLLGFAALLVTVLVSPRYRTAAEKRFAVPAFLKAWLAWADRKELVSQSWKEKCGKWVKCRLPESLRAGYFDPFTGLLYPAQWLCITMLGCAMALYWLIGGLKGARLGGEFAVPAIGYVVVFLIVLVWMLAGVEFFVDRYRVPLLFIGLAFVAAGNLVPQSDHYFAVKPGIAREAVSPGEVLTAAGRLGANADHPRGRVTLIATAGGGIQAAAWTAQVLTGLQSELHRRFPDEPTSFADSIALISSVSGGAVGTLFFVNQYRTAPQRNGFSASDDELPAIVNAAEKPSLDDVAWALVYGRFLAHLLSVPQR